MSFLENKYSIWYYKIINNAKHRVTTGYTEKHHIIPRSLTGTDDDSNIVKLTAREHFVCHLLLTKMVTGHYQDLMKFAVGKFIQTAPGQQRAFTSWEYKKIRETISEARTGKKHSDETRKKLVEFYTLNSINDEFVNVIKFLSNDFIGNEIHTQWVEYTELLETVRKNDIISIVPELKNELQRK